MRPAGGGKAPGVTELLVDLAGIRQNTAAVVALLRERGVRLVAVTKGCLGDGRVAQAMLDGGAVALADTRDANLRRLRAAHPDVELHRIYLPPLSADFESGDVTYVSSVDGARAVAARVAAGERRRVILMLETGDYREGVTEQGLESLARAVAGDPRLELAGSRHELRLLPGWAGWAPGFRGGRGGGGQAFARAWLGHPFGVGGQLERVGARARGRAAAARR